jgi:hypothetical protein
MRNQKKISKNTLFRYVYIYDVTNEYLGNMGRITETIILDKDLGLGNVVQLTEALNDISRRNYITIEGSEVYISKDLVDYIDSINSSDKVKEDLNKVLYFIEIVSSYNEDIILSAFFNDPNVENAVTRGKKEISLNNNRLQEMLEEFEKAANENGKKLDKYDVFSSWLDYVFEIYLQGKSANE